jgi:hypothetical protein
MLLKCTGYGASAVRMVVNDALEWLRNETFGACFRQCIERSGVNHKEIRVACLRAEIRIRDHPSTKQER